MCAVTISQHWLNTQLTVTFKREVYLSESPALPSAMVADTAHPEGDAPSAYSHSPQGPKEPHSPADHHPQL